MCSANYYMSAGTCSLCPPGTVPNAEGNNAFSCACAENYTRLNGAPNSACSRCPDNSTRSSGNSSCSCILDFYPVTPTMMMPCQGELIRFGWLAVAYMYIVHVYSKTRPGTCVDFRSHWVAIYKALMLR